MPQERLYEFVRIEMVLRPNPSKNIRSKGDRESCLTVSIDLFFFFFFPLLYYSATLVSFNPKERVLIVSFGVKGCEGQ